MPASFSQFLPRFGGEATGAMKPFASLAAERAKAPLLDVQRLEAERMAQAEERGRRAGEEAVRTRYEAALAEAQADYEFRLADQMQQLREQSAASIAEQIAAGLSALEEAIVGPVAAMLGRFIGGAARERAVDELAQAMTFLLRGRDGVRVQVCGPAALLEALQARLPAERGPFELVADEGRTDIEVRVDQTLIETRIAAWERNLGSATAGPAHG